MAARMSSRNLTSFLRRSCVFNKQFFTVATQTRCMSSTTESFGVIYKEHGEPLKVLEGMNSLVKPPDEKEVLVKMLMAPINPSDYNMIEGTYMVKPPLPAFAGNEGVGEVMEVGKEVKSVSVGDWVIAADTGLGTWRTYATVNEDMIMTVDKDIPVLSAATLAVNPCTAYRMLKDFVKLSPGDVVIQNSSNSGVGQSVIQIAKAWDIQTINIVRKREKMDEMVTFLKDLGATHVVTEEFCRTPEMKDLIRSCGSQPKLAFNGVGGKSATELLRNLGQKGVIVTYGGMSRQPIVIPTGVFIFKEIAAVGYWNANWNVHNRNNPERKKMLSELCEMVRNCQLKPPKSELYPIKQFDAAVKSSMAGFQEGKKVLVMHNV